MESTFYKKSFEKRKISLDENRDYYYNRNAISLVGIVCFLMTLFRPQGLINKKERCLVYEDDIPAEEETEIQGSRIPFQNEHC